MLLIGIDPDVDTIAPTIKETATDEGVLIIPTLSQSQKAIDIVNALLNFSCFDLVFIDGDHRYETVKADFENYVSYCTHGSVIAFHDIFADHTDEVGVWRFWDEIKDKYEAKEFHHKGGTGIGAIKVRPSARPPAANG